MVKVKITFKDGKTRISNFPNNTLAEIRVRAKGINPKIKKVEYAPRNKSKTRRSSMFGWSMF